METKWTDLIVMDSDGEYRGMLGNIADCRDDETIEWLATITLSASGGIDSWPDYFVSAPGEEYDWDTPRGEVDWAGFAEAIGDTK